MPGMRRVVGVVRQQRGLALPTIVVVLMVLGVSCTGGERAASDRAPGIRNGASCGGRGFASGQQSIGSHHCPRLGRPATVSRQKSVSQRSAIRRGAAGLARVPAGRGSARQVEAVRPGGESRERRSHEHEQRRTKRGGAA